MISLLWALLYLGVFLTAIWAFYSFVPVPAGLPIVIRNLVLFAITIFFLMWMWEHFGHFVGVPR